MSPYITDTRPKAEQCDNLRNAVVHLDDDPAVLSPSLDPFTVTTCNGFMPLHAPLVQLPPAFAAVATLAENMPVAKHDGSPGLLATYQLGPMIEQGSLPDLSIEIDKLNAPDGKPDLPAITALFRDYAFLASAYLLEPCWERQSQGLDGLGLGREVLPACIAGPLVKMAKMSVPLDDPLRKILVLTSWT